MFDRSVVLLLWLLAGTVAWSQAQPTREYPPTRGDVYVGGAFTGSDPASTASAGLGGGLDFRVLRWIGVAGDFSVYVANSGVANTTTLSDYLVGPRIEKPLSGTARVSPFADFLAGGQSFNNSSSQHSYYYANGSGAAFAGDVGADFRVSRHLALRGQGGFIFSQFSTPPTKTDNTRWRAGTYLVYRF